MEAWQIATLVAVLAGLALTLLAFRWFYYTGKAEGDRRGYERGFYAGYDNAREEYRLAKERERIDAKRSHDERPDSEGNARLSQVRFTQRNG